MVSSKIMISVPPTSLCRCYSEMDLQESLGFFRHNGRRERRERSFWRPSSFQPLYYDYEENCWVSKRRYTSSIQRWGVHSWAVEDAQSCAKMPTFWFDRWLDSRAYSSRACVWLKAILNISTQWLSPIFNSFDVMHGFSTSRVAASNSSFLIWQASIFIDLELHQYLLLYQLPWLSKRVIWDVFVLSINSLQQVIGLTTGSNDQQFCVVKLLII